MISLAISWRSAASTVPDRTTTSVGPSKKMRYAMCPQDSAERDGECGHRSTMAINGGCADQSSTGDVDDARELVPRNTPLQADPRHSRVARRGDVSHVPRIALD